MKNRRLIPIILYAVMLVLVFSWANGLLGEKISSMPYSQVVELFRNEQVKSFVVEDDTITMELYTPYDGELTLKAPLADAASFRAELGDLFAEQSQSGILKSYHFVPEPGFSPYELILPLLLVGLVLLFVWAMFMSRANNSNPLNNFGKARTVLGVPDGKKVTFADVAGADEEKEELQEVCLLYTSPSPRDRG